MFQKKPPNKVGNKVKLLAYGDILNLFGAIIFNSVRKRHAYWENKWTRGCVSEVVSGVDPRTLCICYARGSQ